MSRCTAPSARARGAVALAAEYAARSAESADRELVRLAITDGRVEVAYQPIVSVATGEVVAFEALARVLHAELGPVAPGRLVPDIGDGALGAMLDRLVLEAACRALADPARAGLALHVNLSPVLGRESGARGRDARRRRARGTRHVAPASRAVGRGARRGLRGRAARSPRCARSARRSSPTISVRGARRSRRSRARRSTCSSSIARSWPSVDSDERARAVAAAVVALGSTLGLSVIAEGVERVEQLDELRGLGCHLAQGHLFGVGRAAPA